MAKKDKQFTDADDARLADAVRASAQQIWQAGLGAFAKAQAEGGKMFGKLVKDGAELQQRTHQFTEGRATEVAESFGRFADGVSRQASGTLDRLEQVFQDRVARALNSLGVPTQAELQSLATRVDELGKLVEALEGRRTAPARKRSKASAPAAAAKSTRTKQSSTRTKRDAATGKQAARPARRRSAKSAGQ